MDYTYDKIELNNLPPKVPYAIREVIRKECSTDWKIRSISWRMRHDRRSCGVCNRWIELWHISILYDTDTETWKNKLITHEVYENLIPFNRLSMGCSN